MKWRPPICCALCINSTDIELERQEAVNSMKRQSKKMLSLSAKRFKPLNIGDNVMIPVPELDRGKVDAKNIEGVVMTTDQEKNLYSVGTSHGINKQKYTSSQLIPCKSSYLSKENIPVNDITLREVSTKQSLVGGPRISTL